MDQQDLTEALGVVTRMIGKRVLVRLESGEEVLCHFGRNHPWGNQVGTTVRIRFRPIRKDKPPLIVMWNAQ
jgi:uncharacterized OB-fold protein